METEQPTQKALVNMFSGEASFVDESLNKKKCLKENSTKLVLDERHKILNINNLNKDIEEDENEQAMESDPEIRAFMQKYSTSVRTFTKSEKVQNIFNFFYDRDFKDLIEKIAHRIMKY